MDAVVFPHPTPSSTDSGPPRYPHLSPVAYMRGVTTIAAYRTYFSPETAVQWTPYLLWLRSRAVSVGTSALRDLDERACTHFACYREEYHNAAGLRLCAL